MAANTGKDSSYGLMSELGMGVPYSD